MSPLVIQNDDASRRLVRDYGIKGRVPVLLDEIIVPTADIGDFAGSSPYESRIVAADVQQQAAAGAGTYGGLIITPGLTNVSVVEKVRFTNVTGAAQLFFFKLFRPADVAAVTVVSTSPAVVLNGVMRTTGFAPAAPITSSIFHHTATNLGADFGFIYVPDVNNVEYVFPRGMVLDGSDPLGPISLCVQTASANQQTPWMGFHATVYSIK